MKQADPKRVLQIALSQIDVHEVPWGSNSGPKVREYQAATFLRGTGWPWCVAFCQWVLEKAGAPLPYRSAGVYDLLRWAKRAGVSTWNPSPGDLVCFGIGQGHIGILERIDAHDVHTIDGNTSDQVARRTRPRSQVVGYIDTAKAIAAKPRKQPLWTVTTSENGHRKVHAVWAQSNVGKLLPKVLANKLVDGVTITRGRKKPK
jgi:hypothetical protein